MATLQAIRDRIAAGELVVGAHVGLLDCAISELLGQAGCDFVWIDTEHSAIDRGTLQAHLIAATAGGAAAFVRLPWNDPVMAKPVLEMGPAGLVFPMICSAEDAQAAVSACRYPPAGIRGFGPRRASRWGMIPAEQYIREASTTFWRIMQIEHADAVKNLASILAVDGVDAIVVGPNDLSGSIGRLGETRHPEVVKLYDRIAGIMKQHRTPFGVSIGDDPEIVRSWIERGVDWIATGSDSSYVVSGARRALEQARAFGRSRGSAGPARP